MKIQLLLLPLLVFASCSPDFENTGSEFLDKVLPYVAKLPDDLNDKEASDSLVLAFYETTKKERRYTWKFHKIGSDSMHYFLITRLDPSIKRDKYRAICGKFHLGKDGEFDYYEEVFWTWKMKSDSLEIKSKELFSAVVQDKSLLSYLPGHSKGEWIEFPDRYTYYDTNECVWKKR